MARPGAWENPLCPIDINTMHNIQEPGFKLSVPQQMEQPVLSPDAADDEMGQSHQQYMSIQQHQAYPSYDDDECPQIKLNIDIEDHEADNGDCDDMEVETAEKKP